jgi:sugar-specific transcriptional regulator TrmB
LSTTEQRAYLELLSGGAMTATPLARALRLPATTVQSVLARLASRGIAHVSKRGTRSVYEAKDPVVLKKLAEQRLAEITETIPLLKKLRAEGAPATQVRVYDRERITDIFRQAVGAKRKLVHEIVSAREIQAVLGEKFHFTRRRVAAGVRLKSLRVEANEIKRYSRESHVRELRETKFLPRELTFRSSVMFWDGEWAAFFGAPEEGVAVVVRSASIHAMLAQLFELLWSVSRRMETGE